MPATLSIKSVPALRQLGLKTPSESVDMTRDDRETGHHLSLQVMTTFA